MLEKQKKLTNKTGDVDKAEWLRNVILEQFPDE